MLSIKRIHHVAYRCIDAKKTAEFYKDVLNMELTVAISEERVPSTKEPNPYMHIFLDAGMGNVLAFFEITGVPEMGFDPNTPKWVQHIALEVSTLEMLEAANKNIRAKGLDVIGVVDHGIFKSIYFFDPNGHRIELCCNTNTEEQNKKLKEVAPLMLEEWSKTKLPPKHAAFLHEKEFKTKK